MPNKRYECRTKLSLPNTNPNVRTNEHGMTPPRIGIGFCNFEPGSESESQKSDSGHLCSKSSLSSRERFLSHGHIFERVSILYRLVHCVK